jgi:UDPglucose--hexose-1-phosphate uridylyltransferase
MSEVRQDRTSGRCVIIAPTRAHRPGARGLAGQSAGITLKRLPFDPHCPFCPGHEDRLPGIVAETRVKREPGWTVRVVPNKFPALQLGPKVEGSDRCHLVAEGYGFHEVIIETPRHDAELVSMTDLEMEAVVTMYRGRCKHLLTQPGIEAVVLFRNHGRRGGASQSHPHAQVVALGFVPPGLKSLLDWGRRYHIEKERCATCDEIAIECDLKSRIVEDVRDFLVLVPFAAEHPCEMWIVPKQHQASFLDLADAQCRDFALLLRRTLRRLRRARDDPPYNFVIDSAPRLHLQSPSLHWRLRIAPDLATWGGFELGAGIAINPSVPEHDASLLREAVRHHRLESLPTRAELIPAVA